MVERASAGICLEVVGRSRESGTYRSRLPLLLRGGSANSLSSFQMLFFCWTFTRSKLFVSGTWRPRAFRDTPSLPRGFPCPYAQFTLSFSLRHNQSYSLLSSFLAAFRSGPMFIFLDYPSTPASTISKYSYSQNFMRSASVRSSRCSLSCAATCQQQTSCRVLIYFTLFIILGPRYLLLKRRTAWSSFSRYS